MIKKIGINLDVKIIAEQMGLLGKSEFHITIIGSDTGNQILNSIGILGEEKLKKQLKKIDKLFKSHTWKVSLGKEFFYLKQKYERLDLQDFLSSSLEFEIRESVVQLAEINHLEDFYLKLNHLLDTNFETPLPHVTLFTNSTMAEKKLRGIGIYSRKQFEELYPEKLVPRKLV